MRSSTKITYVILICLFIGGGGSYLFKHYVLKTPNKATTVQVQTAATENVTDTHYKDNPVNSSTGIPDKAKVLSTLPKGALVYQSPTNDRPYGVLNPNTIVNLTKKTGDLYEINYDNNTLYINSKDITFNLN